MVHIRKKDLDKNNFYKKPGINTKEDITCDNNLGYIKFKESVITEKSIILGYGSGIEANWGIEAREKIETGLGIKAGWGVCAIEGIKSGEGIEAGCRIVSRKGIEAREGIKAGKGIICEGVLKFSYQLFAGIRVDRNIKEEDLVVKCGKLETDGKIVLGNLIETGNIDNKIKIIDGKKYKLIEEEE